MTNMHDNQKPLPDAVLEQIGKGIASGKPSTTTPCASSMPPEHIAQFFTFAHLPARLQAVSKPFADLAEVILTLPRNPERTVALRKLLESKDAAVRAALAK